MITTGRQPFHVNLLTAIALAAWVALVGAAVGRHGQGAEAVEATGTPATEAVGSTGEEASSTRA